LTYTTQDKKIKKKQKLRNNEYYDTQKVQDKLYQDSCKGKIFKGLLPLICEEENILLAYRNIKRNTGSNTAGTDGLTIKDIEDLPSQLVVDTVREMLHDYKPGAVRRVFIPKPNGNLRPLGIPNIWERLAQQSIKQILEPICEAKFHKHSYGFRPNRSTKHAIAKAMLFINFNKLHYVVDIDIKGFFDNVNHGKLLKQMWHLGIQDKQLISIISKMLKAEIDGEGHPIRGTPQGGVLSPLLSNIVLNELDWWISSQWESMKTRFPYKSFKKRYDKMTYDQTNKITALKRTNLKECYIVRYADDFKVFCRDCKSAQKIFIAIKQWLKERLSLDISPDKSKVTNLRKNYTEFLGIKLKATAKRNKYVCKSHMTDKAIKQNVKDFKDSIKNIQRNPCAEQVNKFNSQVLGKHFYYNMATHISEDFRKISFLVNKSLYNRLHKLSKLQGTKGKTYMKYYGNCNTKTYFIEGIPIFPIAGVKTSPPMSFNQDICNYTKQGRLKIHNEQQCVSPKILRYLMENPVKGQSVEYNDNRQSLYTAQKGCCGITGKPLKVYSMECHRKIPKENGGTDEYSNLILLNNIVHKLVHAVAKRTIDKYMTYLILDEKALSKLNSLRQNVGISKILLAK